MADESAKTIFGANYKFKHRHTLLSIVETVCVILIVSSQKCVTRQSSEREKGREKIEREREREYINW